MILILQIASRYKNFGYFMLFLCGETIIGLIYFEPSPQEGDQTPQWCPGICIIYAKLAEPEASRAAVGFQGSNHHPQEGHPMKQCKVKVFSSRRQQPCWLGHVRTPFANLRPQRKIHETTYYMSKMGIDAPPTFRFGWWLSWMTQSRDRNDFITSPRNPGI